FPFRDRAVRLLRSAFHVDDANGRIDHFQAKQPTVISRQPLAALHWDAHFIDLESLLSRDEVQLYPLRSLFQLDLLDSNNLVASQDLDRHRQIPVTEGV